jgi:hypothetical protein
MRPFRHAVMSAAASRFAPSGRSSEPTSLIVTS